MKKLKTKSAAKKRFKLTDTGKIKYRSVGKRHLLEHKNSATKRNKRKDVIVNKADIKKIKKILKGN